MSFGRRIELTKQVSESLKRLEFLEAGQKGPSEEAEAAVLAAEVDAVYLRWGLAAVEGLTIDGRPADVESLIAHGPEELLAEALAAVRRETGLSEEERKNSESHSISHFPTGPSGDATDAAA